MLWPSPADYAQAVKDYPQVCLLDPKLKGGKPRRGTNNLLLVYSGGFSTVFPIEVLQATYALRCWIKDVGDAKRRYEAISDYLKQMGLPYFVDFEYVPEGILIDGKRYPITRMEWADGETLRDFIEQNLQDANLLKTAAQEFLQMFEKLHAHHIAHGDLQDGNILLKRNGNQVEIRLIDYDSLYVPDLRGHSSPTPGLPEYQHPARGAQLDENVDYFSELVIYLSFLSLSENPALWHQFKGRSERGLLFSKADFENPSHSDVFQELEKLSPDVQQLASTLKDFCAERSIAQLLPLESVIPKTNPEKKCYDLGMDYFRKAQYPRAIDEFQKAINLKQNYKEAYHGLGLAYQKTGELDKAIKAAKAALTIDSTYSPAQQLLEAIGRKPPPSPSPRPAKSPSPAPSPPVTSQSTPSNPPFNIWQVVAAGLGAALIICAVVLGTQMRVKKEAFDQVAELTSQLEQKKSEIQGVASRVRTLESEKATLSRGNRALRAELEQKEAWQNTLSEDVVKLRNQLDEGKKALASQERENRHLRNRLAEKNSEIQEQVSIANRLLGENTDLVTENQNLQNQLSESEAEAKKQRAIVQQLRGEKVQAHRESENLHSENATITGKNRNLRRENATLTSKNRNLHRENAGLESEVKSLESKVERLRNLKIDRFLFAPIHKSSGWNRMSPRSKSRKRAENNNRGFTAFNEKRYSKAMTHFRAAIRVDPEFATAHYNLGCSYLKMRRYVEAVDSFRKAVQLDTSFKEAYYNLALAHFGIGSRVAAKNAAKSALQIDGNYLLALAFLKAIE